MSDYIDVNSASNPTAVTLSGNWVLGNVATIRHDIDKFDKTDGTTIRAQFGRLDTAGVQILHDFMARIGSDKIEGLTPAQQSLVDLVRDARQDFPDTPSQPDMLTAMFTTIGKASVDAWHGFLDLLRFIGETVVRLGGSIRHPQRFRGVSIIRHIRETGLNAIPIVALIAFLISVVLAYQGAGQLKRFGAEIFTINMVSVSVLREMGVLLTAIMIAGRSGSAFTAEIGVMKVNEELDAMRIIGVTPFEVLVLPRLIALMLTMPLLAFVADLMGIVGGGVISATSLDIGPAAYLERIQDIVKMKDFWVGILKAPVFGFFIGVVGCMRGLQVSGSAESVGKLTTTSVVQSIFLVLLLDALFAVFFTKIGI